MAVVLLVSASLDLATLGEPSGLHNLIIPEDSNALPVLWATWGCLCFALHLIE